jgi:hypothetical protein
MVRCCANCRHWSEPKPEQRWSIPAGDKVCASPSKLRERLMFWGAPYNFAGGYCWNYQATP